MVLGTVLEARSICAGKVNKGLKYALLGIFYAELGELANVSSLRDRLL